MTLVFRRTGTRRYLVEAKREGLPDLVKDPAPGFDRLIPHDLMHLIVEAQLEITNGIFGQLSAGGDAGSFWPIRENRQSAREIARIRTHQRTRGKSLLREGRDDCVQSERAAWICWNEWLRRSGKTSKNFSATQQSAQLQNIVPSNEMTAIDEKRLDSICSHIDELSSVWSQLEVGESMYVSWPDLSVSK